jgi:hypothetical protein
VLEKIQVQSRNQQQKIHQKWLSVLSIYAIIKMVSEKTCFLSLLKKWISSTIIIKKRFANKFSVFIWKNNWSIFISHVPALLLVSSVSNKLFFFFFTLLYFIFFLLQSVNKNKKSLYFFSKTTVFFKRVCRWFLSAICLLFSCKWRVIYGAAVLWLFR